MKTAKQLLRSRISQSLGFDSGHSANSTHEPYGARKVSPEPAELGYQRSVIGDAISDFPTIEQSKAAEQAPIMIDAGTKQQVHNKDQDSTSASPNNSKGLDDSRSRSPSRSSTIVSRATAERSAAAKIYFETHFERVFTQLPHGGGRGQRRSALEKQLNAVAATEGEKRRIREQFLASESATLRLGRNKISVDDFTVIRTIGHGAFGIVKLVRETKTGRLLAMKVMNKADLLKNGQEGHVRAERDLLTTASETGFWIVKLLYAFQSEHNLYLVMEYMAGGDLLGLLIRRDIFDESTARYYAAEMVCCISEAHGFGYIHRDIKPDNFLLDANGHLRLSDFGLATDHHWSHDGEYYAATRRLMSSLVNEQTSSVTAASSAPATTAGDDDYTDSDVSYHPPDAKMVLEWRKHKRRNMAFSVVGTNNYIAPEILRGRGYDRKCDWWSLGVIIFEMLYGYPPFMSDSRSATRKRILSWRRSLRFPNDPIISRDAKDLITRLLCDATERLDEESIRSHPWFRGIGWERFARMATRAAFQPQLRSETDTRYFDDLPDDVVVLQPDNDPATASDSHNGEVKGEQDDILDMRKRLAFRGFTYRSPVRPGA